MWKKTLLAIAGLALVALPALAEDWRPIVTTTTSAGVSIPTLASTVTPIQGGVNQVRVVADTADAWIIFQMSNADDAVKLITPLSAANLNGRMSELGVFLPASTVNFFRVAPNMIWHVQGDGGTASVSVTQVSK